MAFADHLPLRGSRSVEERENLSLLEQSGQMLLSLVEDILSLARHVSGRDRLVMEPVDVGESVDRRVAASRHLPRTKRQSVSLENRAEGAVVTGDASDLMRVLNSLLGNAI